VSAERLAIVLNTSYHIISKSQDYGNISAQNTTKAPNNMQKLKVEKLKTKKSVQREMFSGGI